MEVHEAATKATLVQQFEPGIDADGQGALAAPYEDRPEEEVALVDQSPGDRRGVELALDSSSRTGHGLQRPGKDHLLGCPPDLRKVPGHHRLIVVSLPVNHRLIHAPTVQMGADVALEIIDERVHFLIRCRPAKLALLVLDVAVERRNIAE